VISNSADCNATCISLIVYSLLQNTNIFFIFYSITKEVYAQSCARCKYVTEEEVRAKVVVTWFPIVSLSTDLRPAKI